MQNTWSLSVHGQRYIVRNVGLGISQEHLERIFERYYRAEVKSSVPRVFSGSGIGLFVCRQTVEAHQGKIWAECEIPAHDRDKPFPHNLQNCVVRFVIDLPDVRLSDDEASE